MDNVVELWRIILSCVRSLYGMDFEKSQISQNISTSEAKCILCLSTVMYNVRWNDTYEKEGGIV